jgi:hypothetical protein
MDDDESTFAPRRTARDAFSASHLAQTIAALLSDGQLRTAKEIARSLSRAQNYPISSSGVNKSLAFGAKHFGFVRTAENKWTVKAKPRMPHAGEEP